MALAPDALDDAVAALLRVTGSDTSLKVDSGEHLAAILLTAVVGAPTSVDTSGGVDLTFRRPRAGVGTSWPFGERPTAAMEIKSLPGPFRERHRHQEVGATFGVTIRSAAEILEAATAKLEHAEGQLVTKDPSGKASRSIFLIIHPFDGLAVEALDESPLIGHLLPAVVDRPDLETLWVLWHPDLLAFWSRETGGWTDVIVTVHPPDDPRSAQTQEDTALMLAERRYLDAIGHVAASPWAFRLSAAAPGSC